jgi:hypothetical protein
MMSWSNHGRRGSSARAALTARARRPGDDRHARVGRAADLAARAKTSRQIGTGKKRRSLAPTKWRHWPLAFSLLLLVP